MKIIHTFLPVLYEINKRTIYLMTASMLLAKKYYNNVVLYTDKKTAKIVREIGLPYDEINDALLDGIKVGTFSIPKLLVYKEQTDPFLHIDLDSFIYKKFFLDDFNGIYSAYNEGFKRPISLDNESLGFYNTYYKNTLKILDKLPIDFKSEIDFQDIPNMSLFGSYNAKLIADASDYCLNIYENNRDFFDNEYYNACIIEQLFIPVAIKLLNKNQNYKFHYLCEKLSTSIEFVSKEKEYNFPFLVKSVHEIKVFDNELDLYENYNYNFNGYLHLCGFKNFDKILFLLRTLILLEFKGINYLNKINEIFPEKFDYEKDLKFYEDMNKNKNKNKTVI